MGFWTYFSGCFIGEFSRRTNVARTINLEEPVMSSKYRWDYVFGGSVKEYYESTNALIEYPDDFWDFKKKNLYGCPKYLPHGGEGHMKLQIHKLSNYDYNKLYDEDTDEFFKRPKSKKAVYVVKFAYSDEGMSRDDINNVVDWWNFVIDNMVCRYADISIEDSLSGLKNMSFQDARFKKMTQTRLKSYYKTLDKENDFIYE